jgi:uncharacterized protein (DUF486 family)
MNKILLCTGAVLFAPVILLTGFIVFCCICYYGELKIFNDPADEFEL